MFTSATVDKEAVTLATGKTADVIVTAKDQYGLAFTGEVTAENAEKATGLKSYTVEPVTKTVDETKETVLGQYKVTLTAADKAAKGDVVIKVDGKEAAKVNLTVEEAGKVADYVLKTTNTVFDLKTEKGQEAKTITATPVDAKGLETKAEEGVTFKFVTKSKVAVVTPDGNVSLNGAKAGDKIVVEYVKVEGALETTVKTIELTVVDTTPTLKSVTMASNPTAITKDVTDYDLSKVITVVAEGSNGEVPVIYALENETALIVYEADEKGNSTGVKLGKVELTSNTLVSAATFKVSDKGQPSLSVKLNAATDKDQEGKINLAFLSGKEFEQFEADTNISVKVAADKVAPTVSELKVNSTPITISNDVIDLSAITDNVTTATATLSEDVKLTITVGESSVTKDVETTMDLTTLLAAFGKDTAALTADKLAGYNNATVTLEDKAGNKTTYTLKTSGSAK